jgi:hypothetical protein
LADLDIINPFYRSADVRKELEDQDITLITSIFTNTNAEVPAIPQEILSVFDQPLIRAVLDIGGEEPGARVVSCLSDHFNRHLHSIYYVINMNRPFSDSRENISEHIKSLTRQFKIKPSGLINNTNLLEFTDIEQLLETNQTIQSIGESLGIPLVFCTGLDNQYPSEWGNTAPDGIMFFRMKRYIQYL